MHRLPNQRGARHFRCRNAVRLACLGKNREHPEIERVVGNEKREGDTEHAGGNGEIWSERIRDQLNHAVGHRINHLGSRQNAGKDAGRENESDHGHHIACMAGQQRFLLLNAGIVQQQRDSESDHEQHRKREHAQHERHQ